MNFKKINFLILFLVLATISTMVMAMGSKQNNWFEQFEKAEDAERELIKLFPVGTDVDKLKKFLEKNEPYYYALEKENIFVFRFKEKKIPYLLIKEWILSVEKNKNKISNIKIKFSLIGL